MSCLILVPGYRSYFRSVRYRLNAVILRVFLGTAISKEILAILVNSVMFFFMLKALKAFKIALKRCFSYVLFGYRIMRFRKPLRSN